MSESFYIETPSSLVAGGGLRFEYNIDLTRVDVFDTTNYAIADAQQYSVVMRWFPDVGKTLIETSTASAKGIERTVQTTDGMKYVQVLSNGDNDMWRAQCIEGFTNAKPCVLTVQDASSFRKGDEVKIVNARFSAGKADSPEISILRPQKITAVSSTSITIDFDSTNMTKGYIASSGYVVLRRRGFETFKDAVFTRGIEIPNGLLAASSVYHITGIPRGVQDSPRVSW